MRGLLRLMSFKDSFGISEELYIIMATVGASLFLENQVAKATGLCWVRKEVLVFKLLLCSTMRWRAPCE